MSTSVKIVSALLAIHLKGKHNGSRSLPSVHPSAMLNARNKSGRGFLPGVRQPLLVELRFRGELAPPRATAWRSLAACASP
jgi:hypothetical protein